MVELTRDFSLAGIDPAAHVFASEAYLSAKSRDFGWLVSPDFSLPFFVDHIAFFRRLVFTDAPLARRDGLSTEAQQLFLNAANETLRRSGICDFVAKPQSNAVFDQVPSAAVSTLWGTYETRIDRPDDELLKSFHPKHRNVIQKAIRDEVAIRQIEDIEAIYQCVSATMKRQGLPYYPSRAFLGQLAENLNHQLLLLGAYVGQELQGVAIVPYDRCRGYYLYGGSCPTPAGGSLNLLQFEVMRLLRDRGVAIYDFVGARIDVKTGTKYEGIQRFKVRFGAQLRQGHTFRIVYSPVKYWTFNRLADLKFRLNGRRYRDPIDALIRGDYE